MEVEDSRMLAALQDAPSGADLRIASLSISTVPEITGQTQFNTLYPTHDQELLEYLDSKSISTTYLSRLDGHISDQIREDGPSLWDASRLPRHHLLSVYMYGTPLQAYKYASITCKDIAHYTEGFIPVLNHGQGEDSAINQVMKVIDSCGETWKLADSQDEDLLSFVSVYEITSDRLREIDKTIKKIFEDFKTGHASTNTNGIKLLELAFGANPLDVLKYALFHHESPQLKTGQTSMQQMTEDQGLNGSSWQPGTEVRYVNNEEYGDTSKSQWSGDPRDSILGELLALSHDRMPNLDGRPPAFPSTKWKTTQKCSKRRKHKAAERAKTVSIVDLGANTTIHSTYESMMDGIEETGGDPASDPMSNQSINQKSTTSPSQRRKRPKNKQQRRADREALLPIKLMAINKQLTTLEAENEGKTAKRVSQLRREVAELRIKMAKVEGTLDNHEAHDLIWNLGKKASRMRKGKEYDQMENLTAEMNRALTFGL